MHPCGEPQEREDQVARRPELEERERQVAAHGRVGEVHHARGAMGQDQTEGK